MKTKITLEEFKCIPPLEYIRQLADNLRIPVLYPSKLNDLKTDEHTNETLQRKQRKTKRRKTQTERRRLKNPRTCKVAK